MTWKKLNQEKQKYTSLEFERQPLL